MKKRVLYTELCYLLGMLLLTIGTAMTVYGGFGMSVVVAPAFIIHLKLSQIFPWFTFGVAEYALQTTVLLLIMLLRRRVQVKYALSLLCAMGYGLLLDGFTKLMGFLPGDILWLRIGFYALGIVLCTIAISLLFHSYFPPAAYEMAVMELARKYGWQVSNVKTVYDSVSLVVAVCLSLAFFGGIEGIGLGTVICVLCYGPLIRGFSALINRFFRVEDGWKLRNILEGKC